MPDDPTGARMERPSRTLLLISVAIYAFMVFGGVVLIGAGLARGVQAARIGLGPTVEATARVISRDVENGKLKVYYAFQPPGAAATYVGVEDVSPDGYAAAVDDAPVDIVYLPDDPNTNWVVGGSPFLGEVVACIFGLLLGIFVLVVTQWRFGLRGLRAAWRASRVP